MSQHDACPKCGGSKRVKNKQCSSCRGYGRGRHRMTNGYIRIWRPGHPIAARDGHVLEHRLVLYEAGVSVPDGHHVHHLNGVKDDNRLENLEVLPASDHHRLHIAQAGVVTNQYGTFPVLTTEEDRRERRRVWNAGRREYKREWKRRKHEQRDAA